MPKAYSGKVHSWIQSTNCHILSGSSVVESGVFGNEDIIPYNGWITFLAARKGIVLEGRGASTLWDLTTSAPTPKEKLCLENWNMNGLFSKAAFLIIPGWWGEKFCLLDTYSEQNVLGWEGSKKKKFVVNGYNGYFNR